jgi:hypothetical protein
MSRQENIISLTADPQQLDIELETICTVGCIERGGVNPAFQSDGPPA